MAAVLQVAIVAYEGVLADESEAFRDVLTHIPGARVLTIGDEDGVVAGPGGAQLVETTFGELDRAEVVVVPGGLGTHRHPEIGRWIRRCRPTWVLTSSTGSALLAAAGLLRGRTAATHWLAGPLLERHGATPSKKRLVVDLPFVSCAGLASTFDCAYVVARAVGGEPLVRAIRDRLRTEVSLRPDVVLPPARPRRRPTVPRAPVATLAASSRSVSSPTRSVEVELEPTRRR